MIVKELWTNKDDSDLSDFLAAVRAEDLVAALHAVEGIATDAASEDVSSLEDWATRVSRRLSRWGAGNVDQARALAGVLGEELGFKGDEDDYYDPSNSLLHRVLERRRGMPILLSIVWMEVGRRARLHVAGIGLPGHFVVRVGTPDGILADPYARGALLTVSECKKKVEEISGGSIPWQADFLKESPSDQILERVLQNLAGSYQRDFDEVGRYRAATFLTALRPDSPQRLLERAEIAAELGVRDLAEQSYSELMERFPETNEAQEAAEKLGDGSEPSVN